MAKRKANTNTHLPDTEKSEIPDHAIEALARCALPLIQAYYESEEGQREFAEWMAQTAIKEQIRNR